MYVHFLSCFQQVLQALAPEQRMYMKTAIFDYPLRAIVQASQIQGGLWARNGSSLFHHTANYIEPPLCTRLRDLDLNTVQMSLLVVEPVVVLSSIIQRYDVWNYFNPSNENLEAAVSSKELKEYHPQLASECLLLLCQLVTELPLPVETSLNEYVHLYLRREILHVMMLGPCVHSDISK